MGLGGQIPLAGGDGSIAFQELIYKEFFSQGDLVRVRCPQDAQGGSVRGGWGVPGMRLGGFGLSGPTWYLMEEQEGQT